MGKIENPALKKKNKWSREILIGLIIVVVGAFILGLLIHYNVFPFNQNKMDDKNKDLNIGSLNGPLVVSNNQTGGITAANVQITQGPTPKIVLQKFIDTVSYQGGYLTQFYIGIANPPQGKFMIIPTQPSPQGARIIQAEIQQSGTRVQPGGMSFPYMMWKVSVFTNENAPKENFAFALQ